MKREDSPENPPHVYIPKKNFINTNNSNSPFKPNKAIGETQNSNTQINKSNEGVTQNVITQVQSNSSKKEVRLDLEAAKKRVAQLEGILEFILECQ